MAEPERTLTPVAEADYLSADPERQAQVARRIDLHFNTPMEMFPFAETGRKPKRFHVFYELGIARRFPDDADLRGMIRLYTRKYLVSLVLYMLGKRLNLALALTALFFIVNRGPQIVALFGRADEAQMMFTVGGAALVYPFLAAVSALVFFEYRMQLENRAYALSRLIVQRSQDLRTLYTDVKAKPDLEETDFPHDGRHWGADLELPGAPFDVDLGAAPISGAVRAGGDVARPARALLARLGGGVLTVGLFGAWAVAMVYAPAQALLGHVSTFRTLQGYGLAIGLGLALSSYALWKTPADLVKRTLTSGSWVRYADLDVDNVLGDQVRRDKERLVEYRSLNKAGD